MRENPFVSFILRHYPLIIALTVTSIFVFPKPDLLGGSGDATDIWKTITTWHSSEVYGSYVLYKGFESVYPYVWFYDLSLALNLDQWFFIKCYYIIMFTVSTTVLFPKIVEKLTGETAKNYTKVILFVVCFLFWVPAGALFFMVDLPSLFYFLILVLLVLCFDELFKSIWYWIILGLMIGLNLCASGQYTLPVVFVAIYLIIKVVKTWKGTETHFNLALCVPLILVALAIKEYNNYFLDVIVGGMRANGAWIPSANTWLEIGFLRLMPTYRQGFCVDIYCNRGYDILQNYYGEIYEQYKDAMLSGGYPITIMEYLDIFIHEPLDCLAVYGSRLFLMFSPDRGYLSFIPLFIAYTLLFIALWYGVSKCRYVKQMFSSKFWIGLAFVSSLIPCLVLVYDPRHAFQLQGLIFAIAICTPWIWCKLARLLEIWKNRDNREGTSKVNYVFIMYVVFLFFCFVMIALLYENSSDSNFYWWK